MMSGQQLVLDHIKEVIDHPFKMERPWLHSPGMVDLTWYRNGDMMSVLIAEDGDAWWWYLPHLKSPRTEFKEAVRLNGQPLVPVKVVARLSEMFEEEVTV